MAELAVRNYACSLFELAEEAGCCDPIGQQFQKVCAIFGEDPDYLQVLASPLIELEKKFSLIDEAFGDALHPYLHDFLKILVQNRKITLVDPIFKQYTDLCNQHFGRKKVLAITAVPLKVTVKERLVHKLQMILGGEVLMDYQVDPSILGGIIIRTGDTQADSSIRTKLDTIRKQITAG